ncbi:MAG: PEP/pyruvate-binding domain-containing protein, partial [Candidatus Margulisiibacteriota bacterium]
LSLFSDSVNAIGNALNISQDEIKTFVERDIRNNIVFKLSDIVSNNLKKIRTIAKLPAWDVLYKGNSIGKVVVVENLYDFKGGAEGPVILIASKATGEEEIPFGVRQIILKREMPHLSHLGVRTRQDQIPFAICEDDEIFKYLQTLNGSVISINTLAEEFLINTSINPAEYNNSLTTGAITKYKDKEGPKPLRLKQSLQELPWVITSNDYKHGVVNRKSQELRTLQKTWLNHEFRIPQSVAIPEGTAELVLTDQINTTIYNEYKRLIATLNSIDNTKEALQELRSIIRQLKAPSGFKESFINQLQKENIKWDGDWESAWSAIKGVWASKWNYSAYLSREQRGMPHDHLLLAVLIQPVQKAVYSGVIHTCEPVNNDNNRIVFELVYGNAEILVSGSEGTPMRAHINKKTGQTEIKSLSSLSVGLFTAEDGIIARSDSNGEDLDNYAGAGLYSSIRSIELLKRYVNNNDPIVTDKVFRNEIFSLIQGLAIAVENIKGDKRDIEYIIIKDEVTGKHEIVIVQDRPM